MGVGVGVNPDDVQRLGWVDASHQQAGEKTPDSRFYPPLPGGHDAGRAERPDRHPAHRAALAQTRQPTGCLRDPPLDIPPLELKMAWSPLLQHNPANRWLRKMIADTARELDGQEPTL